jgi:hypothetical protein
MLLLASLIACTGTDVDSGGGDSAVEEELPTGPGTLALSFRMDADYIATMAEDGQIPVGTFGGSIYAEADATGLGPNDGAVSLADFSVSGIDLTVDGGPTGVLFRSDPLEPQIVWILGCLDVDDPADGCGDVGDPITIPNENKAQVAAESETPVEVYMGMIRP